MDAVEFLRDFRRMCLSYDNCNGCELRCAECSPMEENCDHEKMIRVVEEWAKEHPVKTRLSEFLLLFPNAPAPEDGCPDLCVQFFDSTVSCKDSKGCHECRKKFWFTPIEEEEE